MEDRRDSEKPFTQAQQQRAKTEWASRTGLSIDEVSTEKIQHWVDSMKEANTPDMLTYRATVAWRIVVVDTLTIVCGIVVAATAYLTLGILWIALLLGALFIIGMLLGRIGSTLLSLRKEMRAAERKQHI